MFYPVVFFISPAAKAAGTKVSLIAGKYVLTVPPGFGVQAINGGFPPADQAAEVAALTAQVAQLTADLAACVAGNPPPPAKPTITNMTATPANLPVGGGSVTIDATVVGATSLKLDGVDVVLPITVPA